MVLGKHRGRWMSESSVVYRVNSRIAKATQRNPALKKQKKKILYDQSKLVSNR